MNTNVKTHSHSAKANAKAKSLPDGFIGNPICCSHRAIPLAKIKEKFRFGIRFRLV